MGDIDRHPDGARLVAVIAQVCGNPAHAERNRALLPLLDLRPGETALEVGCGSGVLLRELARLTDGHSRLVGIDPSSRVLDQARRETESDGVGAFAEAIEYHRMDGRALAFPDGAFNAAVCSRVLIHAADPERIVAEMARVVRPGGRVLCIEPAHQFWAGVDDQLREKTSAFTNTNIGRELLGLLRRVGLHEVGVTPHTFIGHELPDLAGIRADLVAGTGMIGAAVRAGHCTAAEADELFAQTERAIERGTFLFCSVHFAVLGHKAAV
jgi:SAM-dependent methyltransferase